MSQLCGHRIYISISYSRVDHITSRCRIQFTVERSTRIRTKIFLQVLYCSPIQTFEEVGSKCMYIFVEGILASILEVLVKLLISKRVDTHIMGLRI